MQGKRQRKGQKEGEMMEIIDILMQFIWILIRCLELILIGGLMITTIVLVIFGLLYRRFEGK